MGEMDPDQLRQFGEYCVNRRHLHLTLRELRGNFRQPLTLAALAGVTVVVGISGPFDTINAFALPQRMAYWAVVVPMTYAAGFWGSLFVGPVLHDQATALKIAGRSFGSAVMVCLFLGLFNALIGLRFGVGDLGLGFLAVYVICLVMECMGHLISSRQPMPAATLPDRMTPAILARLPLERRGALVALTVQDHYVEVSTTMGKSLILMRLSDAISECAPCQGVQIHRSHWVALDQVARAKRVGDAAVVTLKSGLDLPVARPRLRAVQQAGLLPRKG
jgi:hypothetical protein